MLIVMTRSKSTSPNKPFEKVKFGLLGTTSIQQKNKKKKQTKRPISGGSGEKKKIEIRAYR